MMDAWPKLTKTTPKKKGVLFSSCIWEVEVWFLASGMAGTRNSSDRAQSFSISWPCFLLCRLHSQRGFLYLIIKMPPTVLYYPYSLLIPEKPNKHEYFFIVVIKYQRKSLIGLAWVIWPLVVQSLKLGRWSTLAALASLFLSGTMGKVNPIQITLQKE